MTHLKNGYLPENGTLGGSDEKVNFEHLQGAVCLQVKSLGPVLHPGKSLVSFAPRPHGLESRLSSLSSFRCQHLLDIGAALLPKQIW